MTSEERKAVILSLRAGHTASATAAWFRLPWEDVATVAKSLPGLKRRVRMKTPDHVRESILAAYRRGDKHKEISAATGIKMSTVGTILHAARSAGLVGRRNDGW